MKIPNLPVTINTTTYEEYRDLFEAIHNFGYTTDFTYRDSVTTNQDEFISHFIASHYLGENLPNDAMYEEYKDEPDKIKEEIVQSYMKFEVFNQLPVGLVPK